MKQAQVESNANGLYNVIKTFLFKFGLYKLLSRWKWNWSFKVSLEGSRKFWFFFPSKNCLTPWQRRKVDFFKV